MRFGKGDKVVVCDLNSPVYDAGNDALSEVVPLDKVAEPLSKYEESLKAEINVKENEIVRLLKENEDLRVKYETLSESLDEFKKRVDDMCEVANGRGRIKGQHEAWELVQKVYLLPESGGYNSNELLEIFGTSSTSEILRYTYAEVAAKVAEWERQKEICVGDVLLSNSTCEKCVVTANYNGIFTLLWNDGSSGNHGEKTVREYKKVGHIDVNAFLKQIGENDA